LRPGRKAGINYKEKVLELLIKSGGLRPSTIEKVLGVSHAQSWRILKKLMREGLIVKKDGFFIPTVSFPPKEPSYRAELQFLRNLEIFRAKLNILATTYIEGRSPYLRIPLEIYKIMYPEERIVYGPAVVEVPLKEIIHDQKKLDILKKTGILIVERKKEGGIIIENFRFRESRHPLETGLFYKAINEPERVPPTKKELQEIISEFLLRSVEILRSETIKILKQHGLNYESLI